MTLFKKPAFYMTCLLLFVLGLCFGMLYGSAIIDIHTLIIALAVCLVLILLLSFLMFRKNVILKAIGWILSAALLIAGSTCGLEFYWLKHQLNNAISQSQEVNRQAGCYVLRTGTITSVSQLAGQEVGCVNRTSLPSQLQAVQEMKETGTDFKLKEFDSPIAMVQALKNREIAAVILPRSILPLLTEANGQEDLKDELAEIFDSSSTVQIEDRPESLDPANKPYNILISGIDSADDEKGIGQSLINLLISVNPKTHQVLLTTIPDKLYTETACEPDGSCPNGEKDRLANTGLYGINTTRKSVEKLLETTINYDVLINVNDLADLIDQNGGIEVESGQAFSAGGYDFKEGTNHLDGLQAIAFMKAGYLENGLKTGKSQDLVLEGVLKALFGQKGFILANGKIQALFDLVQTNIPMEDFSKVIRTQLLKWPSWSFYTQQVAGKPAMEISYASGAKAWMIIPDEESVSKASSDIKSVMEGKKPVFAS